MGSLPVPPKEKRIGLEAFVTHTQGIGGKIKTTPEDFVVEELSLPPPQKEGQFTIATVTSSNWETFHLLLQLAKQIGIHPNQIGISGTKDKRAITTQLMSFKTTVDKVVNIHLKDVTITDIYTSNRPITWGDHHGNKFKIVIKDTQEKTEEAMESLVQEISSIGGFPNFFGVQRFGVTRPITHLVGKAIISKKMQDAVMTYIGNPQDEERQESYEARAFLIKTHDFSKALHRYPKHLIFERLMISHLIRHPDDWVGALNTLPLNLLKMFIHSYQSYLFNKILSQRLNNHIPIHQALVGDIVLPLRKSRVVADREGILVTKSNITKVNAQVSQGRGFISSILAGYETVYGKGQMGRIEKKIVEENTSLNNFIVPDIPRLSSRGSRRALLAPLTNLKYKVYGGSVAMEFELLKGCYATSLLREIMKTDTLNYC